MTDATELLRENQTKLSAKASRLRTQLAAVEMELAEVETALKVLTRYGLTPSVEIEVPSASPGQPQKPAVIVYAHLPFSAETGRSPREVHEAIQATGILDVSADNVRTILWRMQQRGQIKTRDGRYWRIDAADADVDQAAPDEGEPATDFLPVAENLPQQGDFHASTH